MPAPLLPKVFDQYRAGLLICSSVSNAFPCLLDRNSGKNVMTYEELTAAGTISDLHTIPFSFLKRKPGTGTKI
jgi:hypothetical protein